MFLGIFQCFPTSLYCVEHVFLTLFDPITSTVNGKRKILKNVALDQQAYL